MRFYTRQHRHTCGIDLHARTIHVCILGEKGDKLLHRNFEATPEAFLQAVAPYRDDLVVGDLVKNGVALTPPLDAGLLPGITREFIFEVGKESGIDVREQVLRDDDLFGADEAFLTSTTREAVPIVRVDDRKIGTGVPGPVTQALLEGFRRKAHAS